MRSLALLWGLLAAADLAAPRPRLLPLLELLPQAAPFTRPPLARPGAARAPTGGALLARRAAPLRPAAQPRMLAEEPTSTAAPESETRRIDPKEALKEFEGLLEQVKAVWTEGKTWDAETRAERRRAIVDQYVRVFAPALAFSGTQLGLSLATYALALAAISASGAGAELLSAGAGLPLVGETLGKIDPTLGNAALALVPVELAAPVLIPAAAFLTPKATDALEGWLEEKGWNAEGLNARIEKVLKDTTD